MAEDAVSSRHQSMLTADKLGLVTGSREPEEMTQKQKTHASASSEAVVPKAKVGADNRALWVSKYYSKTVNYRTLYREFIEYRNAKQKATSMSTDKNFAKCRYADIPCTENTRVILQQRPADDNFIHANWMKMPDGFRYISTQGPLDDTTEDFWHMVVTEKVEHILMICEFSEGDIIKCAKYVPGDKNIKSCGAFKVKRLGKIDIPMEDVKHMRLEVTNKSKPGLKAIVNHYQYINWPDHSTPLTADSVIKLHKIFRNSANTQPVVVHCSAGIGRTATFIALDYGYQRIGEMPDISTLDLVSELRNMRAKSVQSPRQYLFMIISITELICNVDGITRNEHIKEFVKSYVSREKKKRNGSKRPRKDEKNE